MRKMLVIGSVNMELKSEMAEENRSIYLWAIPISSFFYQLHIGRIEKIYFSSKLVC